MGGAEVLAIAEVAQEANSRMEPDYPMVGVIGPGYSQERWLCDGWLLLARARIREHLREIWGKKGVKSCTGGFAMSIPLFTCLALPLASGDARRWEDEIVYVVIIEKFFDGDPTNDVDHGSSLCVDPQ